jgi:hypothetical protein
LKSSFAFTEPLEAADYYWLGFLAGDGGIEGEFYRLSLKLAERDYEHLIKFAQFMNHRGPIEPQAKKCYRVRINSVLLCRRLAEFGITARKSMTLRVSEQLAHDRDFWRGYADANGSLWWIRDRRQPQSRPREAFSLSAGSYALLEQGVAYIGRVLGLSGTIRDDRGSWVVYWTGPKAIEIVSHLYSNAEHVLTRKHKLAAVMMANAVNAAN